MEQPLQNVFPRPREATTNDRQKALLFIPGFCVDLTAYARIASQMTSEGNIIIAVISLETSRLADRHFLDLVELGSCMTFWIGALAAILTAGYAAMRLAPDLVIHLNNQVTIRSKMLAGPREFSKNSLLY